MKLFGTTTHEPDRHEEIRVEPVEDAIKRLGVTEERMINLVEHGYIQLVRKGIKLMAVSADVDKAQGFKDRF